MGSLWLLVKRYLKPYWHFVLAVFALVVGQAAANLYLPTLNADIINNGIAKGDTAYIMQVGWKMIGVTFLSVLAAVLASYLAARAAMSFGKDLRMAVFYKVQSFSRAELNKFGAPTLITRSTNDVQQIQQTTIMALTLMLMAPIMAVGGAVMAVRQDVVLSYSLFIVIPVMLAVVGYLMYKGIPLFEQMQIKIDNINQVLREKIMGIRVIRAFVRESTEAARFDKANRDLAENALRVNRLMAFGMPALTFIMNVAIIAIVWFGAQRVDSGAMPIGNLTAFMTYVMQILFSVMMAMAMFIMLPRAAAAAERVVEVLETEPSISDPPKPVRLEAVAGFVEFRDVEFKYSFGAEPVLKGITFSAGPGTVTGIVGSTGSGKSTMVSLIPRLLDATAGCVCIDGVDVREFSQEDLRSLVGFVPQKAFLFSGTVADNLRFGNPFATDEELWEALQVAQAKDFVEAMPDGLYSWIEQGGVNLSGGQRQRLAIARALVKKAPIYVFDESFSALDFRTDARLRLALREYLRNATVFIVSQRISTVMNANQIVVLNDDGTVAGIGSHRELMETCDVYRDIVYSQLSKEEIA
ncbi:ABC transporter ATP-binding protein [Coprothermobacteraceae bacterium]|nr:ABC transporter ATP-binding protein [Coprothermobacteraceae bacterium]